MPELQLYGRAARPFADPKWRSLRYEPSIYKFTSYSRYGGMCKTRALGNLCTRSIAFADKRAQYQRSIPAANTVVCTMVFVVASQARSVLKLQVSKVITLLQVARDPPACTCTVSRWMRAVIGEKARQPMCTPTETL